MAVLYQYCTQGAILEIKAKVLQEHDQRHIRRHDCRDNENAIVADKTPAAIEFLAL